MISEQDARAISAEWRPKFVEIETFDASWKRCFEMVGDVDRKRLVAWLAKDQTREAVMYAGLARAPAESIYESADAPAVKLTACANSLCKRPCPGEFCCERCVQGLPLLTMRERREQQRRPGQGPAWAA